MATVRILLGLIMIGIFVASGYAKEVCYIQLASFKYKGTATRYYRYVSRIPYRVVLVKKGKWYAVRLGPFAKNKCSEVRRQIMRRFPYCVLVFTDKDQSKDTIMENAPLSGVYSIKAKSFGGGEKGAEKKAKGKQGYKEKKKGEKQKRTGKWKEKKGTKLAKKPEEKAREKTEVYKEKPSFKESLAGKRGKAYSGGKTYVKSESVGKGEAAQRAMEGEKEEREIVPGELQLRQVYIEKARVCMGRRDCQNAIKYLQMAISLGDKSPKTYTYLGYAYYHVGNYAKAVDAFNMAIEVNRNYAEAYEGMGITYLKLKAYSAAKAALGKAYDLKPDEISYGINYAVSCMSTGDLDESLDTFDELESLFPLIPEIHYNKAVILLKKGDKSGAVKELKMFVDLARSPYYADYVKRVKEVINILEEEIMKGKKQVKR